MPCEREVEAIETELRKLADSSGKRVSGANWTHKPGGAFRLTITTGQGNQTLEFPLPEVAEYLHRANNTQAAVHTRLLRFIDSLPASTTPTASPSAPNGADSGEATTELLSEAIARLKAIEMVLVKKGLTTKDELSTLVELLQGAHRRR